MYMYMYMYMNDTRASVLSVPPGGREGVLRHRRDQSAPCALRHVPGRVCGHGDHRQDVLKRSMRSQWMLASLQPSWGQTYGESMDNLWIIYG